MEIYFSGRPFPRFFTADGWWEDVHKVAGWAALQVGVSFALFFFFFFFLRRGAPNSGSAARKGVERLITNCKITKLCD